VVDVGVVVTGTTLPVWLVEEFQQLLGKNRTSTAVDQAALIELSGYPDHIIEQALDAARAWLRKPKQKPIHSLGRWLVGTAHRKLEAEQARGSTISFLSDESQYSWPVGRDTGEETADVPDPIPKPPPRTPQEQIWQTLLQELALQLPKATYEEWLRDSVVVWATDDECGIGLVDAQAKEWLENRLAHTIQRRLASLVGHPVAIRFEVIN
jgi:hypothetical protein